VGSLVINSGGLGTYLVESCSGATTAGVPTLIDCDSWSNFFNPACWNLCLDQNVASAVGGLAPAQTLSITPPVATAPSNLITPGSDLPGDAGQQAQGAVDQQIAQAITDSQAANAANNPPVSPDVCAQYSADWPWPVTGLTCGEMIMWGAGAAIVLYLLPTFTKAFK